jgi:hypothetical protein
MFGEPSGRRGVFGSRYFKYWAETLAQVKAVNIATANIRCIVVLILM